MARQTQGLGARLELAASRLIARIPDAVHRRLAGEPVELDGQVLHPQAQAGLRSDEALGLAGIAETTAKDRANTDRAVRLAHGPTIRVGAVELFRVPGAAGEIDAYLYTPEGVTAPGPLLVLFHGGGFVAGSTLDTHDQLFRLICREARTRVLSVDYRLAPEHPFPCGIDDAIASFAHVAADPGRFGGVPGQVAVGGDSAGGTLALNVSLAARDAGDVAPAYQALTYPICDKSRRRASHDLFGEGFFLTRERMVYWDELYGAVGREEDPRVSPLLTEDLSGLPPTRTLIVGFDPLRDENLELAERLRDAGVETEVTFAADVFHGFINGVGVASRAREIITDFARTFPVGATNAGVARSEV